MKAFNVIWAVQCNSLSVLHYRFGIHWSKTFEKRVSSQSWTHLLKTFETNFPIPLSSQKKTRIYSWLHSSNELKIILTNVALEKLPSFMNWCYVNILNGSFLQREYDICYIENPALIIFMNCCYVSIQVLLFCKAYITNDVFERLLSFNNWCYMSVQALV